MPTAAAVWVDVLPSLRGFNKALSSQVGKSVSAAGTKAGREFSQGMQKKVVADLGSLSRAVAAARTKEANAAGTLRVAEARLNDLRSTGKAKATQLLAAEEALARAQRGLKTAQDGASTSTTKLSEAQRRLASSSDKVETEIKGVGRQAKETGKATETMSRGFRRAAGIMAGALGAFSAGALLKGSVSKAGDFEKTLRTIGVTTGQTGAEMKKLTDLALDMGAKTSFSAQGAADAMLELAKGGLSAAQIEAGALQQTLTLATAGGLELGNAAGYMVQGLTTFGLKAEQASVVAAALAGGANASTASVESMGMALSQVGPSAKLAGLSIQETTAALAAFDNAGVKGSDAGTSLKTMLMQLTPQTEKAAGTMKELGLKFTNAQGQFLPLRDIAEQLKTSMADLSPEMQTVALKAMFGADAFRAAAILAGQGAAGIDKFTKATSDLNAAQSLADAATQGYAGAMEQFQGAVETAQIQIGTKLLPVLSNLLRFAANDLMPALAGVAGYIRDNAEAFQILGGVVGGAVVVVGAYLVAARTATAVTKAWAAMQGLLNGAMLLNPVGLVVAAVAGLGAIMVVAYKRSETFRGAVNSAWKVLQNLGREVAANVRPIITALADAFKQNLPALQELWRTLKVELWPILKVVGLVVGALIVAYVRLYSALLGKVIPVLARLAGPVLGLLLKSWTMQIKVLGKLVSVAVSVMQGMITAYTKVVTTVLEGAARIASALGQDGLAANLRNAKGEFERMAAGANAALQSIKDRDVTVGIQLDEGALAAIKAFGRGNVVTSGGKLVAIRSGKSGGSFLRRNKGGPIGNGIGTRDDVPALLTRGEHVWTTREVAAIGGHGAMHRLRAAAAAGALPRFARGGAVGIATDAPTPGALQALRRELEAARDVVANGAAAQVQSGLSKWVSKQVKSMSPSNLGTPGGPFSFVLPRGQYSVGVPINGYAGHTGQDFPAPVGTPVYAPFAGMFNAVSLGNRSYGNYANLVAGGMRFIGAHLSSFARGSGMVQAGEMLGRVGSTGNSTGPHLHAEFRRDGGVLDPRRLLTFDSGGLLPPGLNLTYNGTGGNELVLTREQTRMLTGMGGSGSLRGSGGSGGRKLPDPRKAYEKVGAYAVDGFIRGLRGTAAQTQAAARRLGELAMKAIEGRGGGIAKRVAAATKRLKAEADKRLSIVNRLKLAQDKLKDIKSEAASFSSGIREGIVASGDVTRGGEADVVIAQLKASVARATEFGKNLALLKKRGLNATALRQIAEAGVEGGSLTAEGLANASAAELKQVNALQAQLGKVAKTTGSTAASALYGAGIKAGEGLVNGLVAKRKAIEGVMLRIAKSMKTAIKKALGIRSPSTVFHDMGTQVGTGFALGIAGQAGHVTAAGAALAGAAVNGASTMPPIRLPAPLGGDGASAPTVQVFIDGHEIESAVVRVSDRRDAALTNSLIYRGT